MSEPRRRKSAADRKAEIVETAIRLSAEIGPNRVTTQHLADAVGVTQPAIFRHFATKSDIWVAVGDHIVSEFTKADDAPGEIGEADPHDLLHRLVDAHLARVTQNPAIPAILASRELRADNQAFHEKLTTLFHFRRDAITSLIRKAQASGRHRAELVAEDAAYLLIAAMHGLSMRWLLEDGGFDLAEEGGRVLGGVIDGFRS